MAVHVNMDFGEYQRLDALNPSSAKLLLAPHSPAEYKWKADHPQPSSAGQIKNQAVHALVLEGLAAFDKRFRVFDGRRDPRTKAYQEWMAANPGKVALNAAEAEEVSDKALALEEQGFKRVYGKGLYEVTLTGTDPDTGCPLKGRPDFIGSRLRDPKNVGVLDRFGLARMTVNCGWHISMAAYLGLIAQNMDELEALLPGFSKNWTGEAWLDFISDNEPHDWLPLQLHQEDLSTGLEAWKQAQVVFMACTESGRWPRAKDMAVPTTEWRLPKFSRVEIDPDAESRVWSV